MKKVYLVTYHYKNKTKYAELFEELKRFPKWWHYIDSSWLVVSEENANKVFDKLRPHLDADINLLVIEVGKDRQGWLSQKAWDWIKANVGS